VGLIEEQATRDLLRRFRKSLNPDREMELLSIVRKNVHPGVVRAGRVCGTRSRSTSSSSARRS
jgi:hypothetical protein